MVDKERDDSETGNSRSLASLGMTDKEKDDRQRKMTGKERDGRQRKRWQSRPETAGGRKQQKAGNSRRRETAEGGKQQKAGNSVYAG
jgi:hypothetical protein